MTRDPIPKLRLELGPQELKMLYSVALLSLPATIAVNNPEDAIFDEVVLAEVARDVSYILRKEGATITGLAQSAALISAAPAVFAPRGTFNHAALQIEWSHAVSERAGSLAINSIGLAHGVLVRTVSSSLVTEALSTSSTDDDDLAIHAAITAAIRGTAPRARAVILTPLARIDDDEQEVLLQSARAIDSALSAEFDIHSVIPGEYIRPSDSVDESGIVLYREARGKVDGSDLVVALFGGHESDGMSKCVAWAESHGTDVLILRDGVQGMSKVVSEADARTRHLVYDGSPEANAAMVSEYVRAQLHTVTEHMNARLQSSSRILPQLNIIREILNMASPALVTRDRLESVGASPEALATLSGFEIQQIADSLPRDVGDRFVGIVTGREVSQKIENDAVVASLKDFVSQNPTVTASEIIEITQLEQAGRATMTATAADRVPTGRDWAAILHQVRQV